MANRQSIHALALGGTLFVPASHKNLDVILSGKKYAELRSVVIDFEDGLTSESRPDALQRLDHTLGALEESPLLRFIRPENPQMLKTMLAKKEIGKIDGFILPKFGLESAEAYLSLLDNHTKPDTCHLFMPSIEGDELFDSTKLRQLRDILLPFRERIICIRFGAEDMLRQLGLRRTTGRSLYDMLSPAQSIATLLNTFKPCGFEVSAPVFPHFSDTEGFKKEIAKELENGLISKTIIHPSQIKPMNALYKVSGQELHEAKTLLSQKEGVINLNGKMGEAKTQSPWAESILKRAALFDVL
jgi:citrate lyase beta subunit